MLQRMRLLERVMADVYGPQTLLHDGFLPPALVHAHPGYLRAMHGVEPVGGRYLHIAAFDLARGPDGNWWVEAQRSQAPSGLGYLLENRLAISAPVPPGLPKPAGATPGRHLPCPDGQPQSHEPGQVPTRIWPCLPPAPTTKPILSTPTWPATWA